MPDQSGLLGWAALLDELERRAAHAVSGEGALELWRIPGTDAAPPPELAERAAAVVATQNRAIATLRAREQEVRSQLGSLGSSPLESAPDAPVYVDIIG